VQDDFYAVIPAGGSGTRLWPLSRTSNPKFLHPLTGTDRSLLQATFDRLAPLVTAGRVYVVNNRGNTLSIVDEAARAVVGARRIPRNVSSATLDPEAGLLYLALKSADRVAVVRLRDL